MVTFLLDLSMSLCYSDGIVSFGGSMARKKEAGVRVWSSIHPDDHLKLQILARRTHFPLWWHVKEAIHEYVKNVEPDRPKPELKTFRIGGE